MDVTNSTGHIIELVKQNHHISYFHVTPDIELLQKPPSH